jgi:hypothetical protein
MQPNLAQIRDTIDRWYIKTMSTQFSGPEYHVCDGEGSWGIVGRVFKSYEKALNDLSERRAKAVQELFEKK